MDEQFVKKVLDVAPALVNIVQADMALVTEAHLCLYVATADQLCFALAGAARLHGIALLLQEPFAQEHFRCLVLAFINRLNEMDAYARRYYGFV